MSNSSGEGSAELSAEDRLLQEVMQKLQNFKTGNCNDHYLPPDYDGQKMEEADDPVAFDRRMTSMHFSLWAPSEVMKYTLRPYYSADGSIGLLGSYEDVKVCKQQDLDFIFELTQKPDHEIPEGTCTAFFCTPLSYMIASKKGVPDPYETNVTPNQWFYVFRRITSRVQAVFQQEGDKKYLLALVLMPALETEEDSLTDQVHKDAFNHWFSRDLDALLDWQYVYEKGGGELYVDSTKVIRYWEMAQDKYDPFVQLHPYSLNTYLGYGVTGIHRFIAFPRRWSTQRVYTGDGIPPPPIPGTATPFIGQHQFPPLPPQVRPQQQSQFQGVKPIKNATKRRGFHVLFCDTSPVLVTSWLDDTNEKVWTKAFNVQEKSFVKNICDGCRKKLRVQLNYDGFPETLPIVHHYHPGPRPYLTSEDFFDLHHPAHPGYQIWVAVIQQQEVTCQALFKKVHELLREVHRAGPAKFEEFLETMKAADKWNFQNVVLAARNLMDQAARGTRLDRFKNILSCYDIVKVKCLVESLKQGGSMTSACPRLPYLVEKETVMLRKLVKDWLEFLEEQDKLNAGDEQLANN